jgi:hypothetical protein
VNDGGFRTTQFSLGKWLEGLKTLIFGNRVGAIRTRDLPLRRRLLYPTELQPQVVVILHPDANGCQGEGSDPTAHDSDNLWEQEGTGATCVVVMRELV